VDVTNIKNIGCWIAIGIVVIRLVISFLRQWRESEYTRAQPLQGGSEPIPKYLMKPVRNHRPPQRLVLRMKLNPAGPESMPVSAYALIGELKSKSTEKLTSRWESVHNQGGPREENKQYRYFKKLEQRIGQAANYYSAGVQAAQRNDWYGAAQMFQASLNVECSYAALDALFNMYCITEQHHKALDILDELVSLCEQREVEEQYENYKRRSGILYALGRCQDVLMVFEEAETFRQAHNLEEDPGLILNAGIACKELEQFDTALALLDRVEATREARGLPPDHCVWINRGSVLITQGRDREALAACERALAICREQGEDEPLAAIQNRALIFEHQGRLDEALAEYYRGEVLARERGLPGAPGMMMNRATLLRDHGYYRQALQLYHQVEQLCAQMDWADEWQLYYNLGIVLGGLGKHKQAMEAYARVELLRTRLGLPLLLELNFFRGLAYKRIRNRKMACYLVQQAYDEISAAEPDAKILKSIRQFLKEQCQGGTLR
jgi:tetratricopeptide (TPR) repeat protein